MKKKGEQGKHILIFPMTFGDPNSFLITFSFFSPHFTRGARVHCNINFLGVVVAR